MRKLKPDGITFLPPKICEPKNIDFNTLETDITILAHQSGIGKTYSVIQYMKENPNTFYFTGRHAIIDEIIEDMGIANLRYAHWEGFDRKCPRKEVVEWHKENPLPIGIICSICKKENCEYRKQFDVRERVFAPYEYLKTDYIKPYPNLVFLDENKLALDEIWFEKELIINWLQAINADEEIIEAMEQGDFAFFDALQLMRIDVLYKQALEDAIYDRDIQKLREILAYNSEMLWQYFYWAEKYNDFSRSYYIPYYYYAFDLVKKNIPIVFLDATFHKNFFQYLLEAYNGEIGFEREITVQIYFSKKQNKNTKVYALRPRGYRPKESFIKHWKEIQKWLIPDLERIKNIFGADNVGIIGHKEVVGNPLIDAEYFGNLRSSNKFADKKALVILGTYAVSENVIIENASKLLYKSQEAIREKYSKGFLIPDKRQMKRVLQLACDGMMGKEDDRTEIYMLKWLEEIIFESEMYQAYHRNRGLCHNRIIITYGAVPEKIKEEFDVKEIEISNEKAFWQKLEKEEKAGIIMRKLIHDIEEGHSPTYIARKYRIWRKSGGVDVKEVKALKIAYESIKNRIKCTNKTIKSKQEK